VVRHLVTYGRWYFLRKCLKPQCEPSPFGLGMLTGTWDEDCPGEAGLPGFVVAVVLLVGAVVVVVVRPGWLSAT
jgi:hypothetical protein